MAVNSKNALSYITFFLLGLVLLSACTNKLDFKDQIINMPYSEAREIIINNGWKPDKAARSDLDVKYRLPHFYYKAEYKEVLACSGTGMGFCLFKFRNEKDEYLRVTTRGGDYSPDDAHPPSVVSVELSDNFD